MFFKKFKFRIDCSLEKIRLDKILTMFFNQFTRIQINRLIRSGSCCINSLIVTKPGIIVKKNMFITITFFFTGNIFWFGVNFYLNILYEDSTVIILNKPYGVIIHPGITNDTLTLINYLLYTFPLLFNLPRAGIVHRLDKDTTGIIVVAKTLKSYYNLVTQFKLRYVEKTYLAIILGLLSNKKMSLLSSFKHKRNNDSCLSLTYFRLIYSCNKFKFLKVYPKTGRKHQIRKHLLDLNCSIIGDYYYGFLLLKENILNSELFSCLKTFNNIALHSNQIIFLHPKYRRFVFFESILPTDTQNILHCVQKMFC